MGRKGTKFIAQLFPYLFKEMETKTIQLKLAKDAEAYKIKRAGQKQQA